MDQAGHALYTVLLDHHLLNGGSVSGSGRPGMNSLSFSVNGRNDSTAKNNLTTRMICIIIIDLQL